MTHPQALKLTVFSDPDLDPGRPFRRGLFEFDDGSTAETAIESWDDLQAKIAWSNVFGEGPGLHVEVDPEAEKWLRAQSPAAP